MAAGDFTASVLPNIYKKVRDFWGAARTERNPNYSTETIKAIGENQRITTAPVNSSDGRCLEVSVVFLKNCDQTVASCTSGTCEVTGPEMESAKADYAPNYCKSKSFTVSNADCKDTFMMEDKVSAGLTNAMRSLEFDLDKSALTFLNANISANTYTGGPGTINGATTSTDFAAVNWNADLMGDFAMIAMMNDIQNPIFVDSLNFYKAWFNARAASGGACCPTDLNKLDYFDNWYFDPRAFAAVLPGENSTFMFDSGDVAFFNKRYYGLAPSAPQGTTGQITFAMPSDNLKIWDGTGLVPVYFDIVAQPTCEKVNNTRFYGSSFEVTLRGGLIKTPAPCAGDTGILKFRKV